ncbi:MAG: carbohydrate ABC transporter permease [Ruminococcaceae bacterium]|nr:carbohydrate ABC transporter permease [Oscillospiraceae bacterium]
MKKEKSIISHIWLILASILCLIPFIVVVSVSLTDEATLNEFGYSIFPKTFSLDAYKYIFLDPEPIIRSYGVTIASTVVGTVLAVLVMSFLAYPLSRQDFKFKSVVSFYVFFTMLFSGGLVPSYMLITQYLYLKDNFWVLVLPGLVTPFHVILFRTFFQQLPGELFDAAKIDGCSDVRMIFQVVLPLSKPVFATVALLGALTRWNDWYTCLLYINDENLVTLQYQLQRIMKNVELIKTQMSNMPMQMMNVDVPTESVRMALAVVVSGPMILVFPFFQKYFAKGLTVGSVKG